MVAFGPLFPGDPDLDHQVDECISLDHLHRLTSILPAPQAQATLEFGHAEVHSDVKNIKSQEVSTDGKTRTPHLLREPFN